MIVLVNTLGPARPDPIAERIARAALPSRESTAPARVSRSRLARLVGSYAFRERTLDITLAGDTLKVQMGGQPARALVPRADGSFSAGASILHFAKGDGPPARVWVDGTGTVLPFDRK